jgi:hypothetical protein
MRTRHSVRLPLAVLVLALAGCTTALPTEVHDGEGVTATAEDGLGWLDGGSRTDDAESSPGWGGGGGRL